MKKYTLSFIIVVTGFILWSCSATGLTIEQKSGAQLWGENCGHCHNIRPPKNYTDTKWETLMLHMRSRANLTSVETEKITDFLKLAN